MPTLVTKKPTNGSDLACGEFVLKLQSKKKIQKEN